MWWEEIHGFRSYEGWRATGAVSLLLVALRQRERHVAAGGRCIRVGSSVTNRPGTRNYDHRHANTCIMDRGSTPIQSQVGGSMTVILFELAPQDRMCINVDLRSDVRYWTRKLAVSELKLRRAVEHVGTNTYDVIDELRRCRIH